MEIIDRLKSPTPNFFKKLSKYSIILIAIAGALLGADATSTIELPNIVSQISTYLIIVGGAVLGTAQTTKV